MLQADARPREQGELGRQQGELGRQQGELGKQQGELGRQQGLLGQEQARLAKIAQVQIKALLADAIRRGLARRVN
jgi:bla regulator protein blaR1